MNRNQENSTEKIGFQRLIAVFGVILFIGKLFAWKLTNSDAVFSDAMESIVNVISAFMGLYSLHLAAKPKDEDHPYGHGKVEFVTSGIEGALIAIAGIMIIYEGINSLLTGKTLNKLDWGILIIAATAIVNYILGYISIKKGQKANSLVLISSGKHLQSDTITTLGVVISLVVVYFTKIYWLDSVVALIFGLYIIFVGYKIVRRSLSGIMDEQDPDLLNQIVSILEENRRTEWIDIHNMKIQQFGSSLHIDAHITLPWYYSLRDAHKEMENVIMLLAKNTRRSVEFNFHMDDCKSISCPVCQIMDCPVRERNFVKRVQWTPENVTRVEKHTSDS
ncbi:MULTISPECIES: cation diffusion facilitator family transporter [Chryseobacterium]|uniref:Cation diffusion facilitator family transporter n=1 Tax=Chryseobacterium camelliae TaxID=1265445 RepID=A0ABU0TN62_9FLAO|nr:MULTISPECIES: cation diffusion facilitator family transporter [Chryseobacterium]MDT3407664.1 cation diffusion facilitator family transporter [Pseudacidovorax intermedius]MDQ1098484.1 cation diffusion facilitator family transporter [Chryseobacterium camelliae]MDQ1102407.1 cation diffusion facilitator family transporter [Chryseobacterium sp. SORGH_AS_1048]MDR6085844.1 cation diffusion facilitator family transporter [Chryseobacterium sp. SORGH_AS_0909]MDR6130208.1 cation diffusion facilitator 